MRVLIVEDEVKMASLIRRGLRKEGVAADVAIKGEDALTKPFSYAELLARLRALVRRGPSERPTELAVGDLRLDPASRQVWRGDTEISLSAKEFAMLETF